VERGRGGREGRRGEKQIRSGSEFRWDGRLTPPFVEFNPSPPSLPPLPPYLTPNNIEQLRHFKQARTGNGAQRKTKRQERGEDMEVFLDACAAEELAGEEGGEDGLDAGGGREGRREGGRERLDLNCATAAGYARSSVLARR